jgi:hypothetical protein
MNIILDRSFVTEFLSATAFSRVKPPIAGLRILKQIADPVTILFDISNVSAFAGKMREAVDSEILIRFLREIDIKKSLRDGLQPWIEKLANDDTVALFARSYALEKGGMSTSVEAEIGYCIWLIAMARSAKSAILVSLKRKNLLRSILRELKFQSSRTSEHGTLHVEVFSGSTQKNLWRRAEIHILWLDSLTSGRPDPAAVASEADGNDRKNVRILFLAANPQTTTALDLEDEIRSIEEQLRSIKFRDNIEFRARLAVRPDDLVRNVREFRPTIVHFSGHGTRGGIVLRNDAGGYNTVSAAALKRFFTARDVEGVVLNSCYSKAQASAICTVVKVVIGTTQALQDEAALRFSVAFYRTLGEGHSVGEAFRDGGDAVALHSLSDCFVLYGDKEHSFI